MWVTSDRWAVLAFPPSVLSWLQDPCESHRPIQAAGAAWRESLGYVVRIPAAETFLFCFLVRQGSRWNTKSLFSADCSHSGMKVLKCKHGSSAAGPLSLSTPPKAPSMMQLVQARTIKPCCRWPMWAPGWIRAKAGYWKRWEGVTSLGCHPGERERWPRPLGGGQVSPVWQLEDFVPVCQCVCGAVRAFSQPWNSWMGFSQRDQLSQPHSSTNSLVASRVTFFWRSNYWIVAIVWWFSL